MYMQADVELRAAGYSESNSTLDIKPGSKRLHEPIDLRHHSQQQFHTGGLGQIDCNRTSAATVDYEAGLSTWPTTVALPSGQIAS